MEWADKEGEALKGKKVAPLAVCSEGEDAILFLLMLSYAWKDPSVDSGGICCLEFHSRGGHTPMTGKNRLLVTR